MSTPILSGQSPANGSTLNLLRPVIGFSVTCDVGLDPASVIVDVDGTPAYDGSLGGFQAGYVPSVDWNVFGGFTFFGGNLSATFQQSAFFGTNVAVTVRVRATDLLHASPPLDQSWTFQTTNLLEPTQLYQINNSNDISSPYNSLFDPLRFTIIAEPVNGTTAINDAEINLSITAIGQPASAIVAGVPQVGNYNITRVAVPGGWLYEVYPAAGTWAYGDSPTTTLHFGATDSTSGRHFTFNGGQNWTIFDSTAGNPGAGGSVPPKWNTLQPASGFMNIMSGLGAPTLDTLHAQDNANPAVLVYDAGGGGFQPGWGGSFAESFPGPFPNNQNQTQTVFSTPPNGFSVSGDTVAFAYTSHVVSPDTGVTYNQSGDFVEAPPRQPFFWNIFQAPPAGHGKKVSVECVDPTTLIVHTTVDGSPADCDFSLSIRNPGLPD